MKLTEFTFKTGNRRGCNSVIRKRVPNIDDPIGREMIISSGGNMMLTKLHAVTSSKRYLRTLKQRITIDTNHVMKYFIAHDQIISEHHGAKVKKTIDK